jgi:hypothetical protein
MLIEKWLENQHRVKLAGKMAVESARKAGVPAYYRDRVLGGIVKEMPDGRRQLIEIDGDRDIVKETLGPRS